MRGCWMRGEFVTITFVIILSKLSVQHIIEAQLRPAMEPDNPGFVWAYGWNRVSLATIGAWPVNDQNFVVKNRAIVYALDILVLIWIPMTISLLYIGGDINELINSLVVLGPVGISIYKIFLFRTKRKVVVEVLSGMARDWARPRTDDEYEAMLQKAKWGRFISIVSVCMTSSMFITFAGFGTYGAVCDRRSMRNDTPLAVGFLYPSYFPFDTNGLLIYLPIWFAQFIGTLLSMVGYAGPDSAITMMILHICGQLATLRMALKNIVDDECIKDRGLYWKRLSAIVKRHEELNRYGEKLEESFNLMLLVQMILCTIVFCFQAFVTITTVVKALTDGEEFPILQIFVFTTFATSILHLFIYCWAGDLLAADSTALSYAPYESEWFRLEPTEARALMMLTFRTRIPLQITAGKFVGFSLELFTTVMKTSMGYLSVLLAMKDS